MSKGRIALPYLATTPGDEKAKAQSVIRLISALATRNAALPGSTSGKLKRFQKTPDQFPRLPDKFLIGNSPVSPQTLNLSFQPEGSYANNFHFLKLYPSRLDFVARRLHITDMRVPRASPGGRLQLNLSKTYLLTSPKGS